MSGGAAPAGTAPCAGVELPTLAGERCALRPLRAADAPSLQQHADDPAVAHNLFEGFPQPYTLELAEAWCEHEHRDPRGYRLEGRMELAVRKDGRAIDAVQYGLTRPGASPGEWRLPTLGA